jgi:CMP-2-keto-3-deoxyoctulosonic acid synthetase
MKANSLKIIVSFSGDEPRIFDAVISASASDVQAAVTEGMQAFNKALHESLARARERHAAQVTDRAA